MYYAQTEQCPNDGAIARLMTDVDDATQPTLDQFGYPQYYCVVCGNIFAVGEKFNPPPPQSVLEEAARQLLTAQPDMSAIDLAGRLQIPPRDANHLLRKIQGRE